MSLSKELLFDATTNRQLTLCILPTEQCNFRCTYCYEDFKIGRMSKDLVYAVKQLIQKRVENSPELKSLNIMWFGGEPLLSKDIVCEIGQFSYDLCQQRDISHIESMTTNGYLLTMETFQMFQCFNLAHFQITLDGPLDIHNRTRVQANGRGTFDVIWKNLCVLRQTQENFTIILRLHISPNNVDAMNGFLPKLKEIFAHDDRFKFYPKLIGHLGGSNCHQVEVFEWEEGKEIENKFKAYLGENKIYQPRSPFCYACMTNNIVIRPNGQLAKCTVAFSNPINDLGALQPDGRLQVDNLKLNYWARGLVTQNLKNCRCPLTE